jgi:hypothetical protein
MTIHEPAGSPTLLLRRLLAIMKTCRRTSEIAAKILRITCGAKVSKFLLLLLLAKLHGDFSSASVTPTLDH